MKLRKLKNEKYIEKNKTKNSIQKKLFNRYKEYKNLKDFFVLWSTQSFSELGSAMSSYALIIWLYQQNHKATQTALLTVCSYLPYVIISLFAGPLTDRWNKKKIMILSDSIAAIGTIIIFGLLHFQMLLPIYIYAINFLNGCMNALQRPAADVTVSLLVPKEKYQKVSGLQSLSSSFCSILTPVIATFLMSFLGIECIFAIDLLTFAIAAGSLLGFIKVPALSAVSDKRESFFALLKEGIDFLGNKKGLLHLILFLAGINFVASMYNVALPAMMLSKASLGKVALGTVNAFEGMAMLLGSFLVTLMPRPKNRIKVIFFTLFLSMSTENFFLAFGDSIPVLCIGAILGWIGIPIMSANMDVILRENIPLHMQGRVFSVRNGLQFFTIPLGYFFSGILIDQVFEPLFAQKKIWVLTTVFGSKKGDGIAFFFFCLGICGVMTCVLFVKNKYIRTL